jgi:hypothetical protein
MVTLTTALKGFRRVVQAAGIGLAVGCIALAATEPGLAWVVLPGLVGGCLFGAILIGTRETGHVEPDADVLRTGQPATVMNIAHVQVAGFGGLALVATCALVALQYEALTIAMATGLIGGVLGAVTTIVYRRHHPTVPDDGVHIGI